VATAIAVYLLALLVGILAGLRSMAASAAISWAARLGVLSLQGTWLAFLADAVTPWIFTVLAIAELVADQLPSTPSRKKPAPFAVRILSGGLCGAALGVSIDAWVGGLLAGVLGAVMGTIRGYELRRRLARTFHKDRPAALLEDTGVILGLLFIVLALAAIA
jgi:uncharacterized membrane protein